MAAKSTLDPDTFPVGGRRRKSLKGHGVSSLGPGDSSDTGSDLAGLIPNAATATGLDAGTDEVATTEHANDIDTDRVVEAEEAGLGWEPDDAEDSQSGVMSDTLEEQRRRRIAEAAYYRAQRRGFTPGNEEVDWLEAEQEIDRLE